MSISNKKYFDYKNKRNTCLSCNSKNLFTILDLGLHSFADRFVKKKDLKLKDPAYPLVLDFCKKCKLIQSKFITNPKDRYSKFDYSYTSSNSNYSMNYWIKYVETLNQQNKLKDKKIIEIGSNDGFLSNLLKKKGAKVLSIDASPFMVKLAKAKNLVSYCLLFDFKSSNKIKKIFGLADLIIANNVFNHSDDPQNFLKGVRNLLKKDGKFIFEQPYFMRTLSSKKFDQIYHEHISYFTVKNLRYLLETVDLKINHISFNKYHGGILKIISSFYQTKSQKKNQILKIKTEEKKGIYNLNFYKKYLDNITRNKERIKKKINLFKNKNYKIIGVGAGAKTNTYLTFNELNNSNIDFITDTSKFKIGKFTPYTRIPIKNDKIVKNYKKVVCIILSWNISEILKYKLIKLKKDIKFLKP